MTHASILANWALLAQILGKDPQSACEGKVTYSHLLLEQRKQSNLVSGYEAHSSSLGQ